MKALPIYTYGFDVLRKKTKKVTKVDDYLINLAKNMFYTMDKASGIGLAACQVGVDLSLAVIDISKVEGEEKQKPLVLINPVVIDTNDEIELEEGCLSIPLLKSFITRPETVFLKYQDFDLNEKTIELNSLFSRVAQHEIDHLNGILFVDHLDKEEKSKIKHHLKGIKNGEVLVNYLLADINTKTKK